VVRAAGGIVWRRRPDGEPELLLVHRPKYDDWSLPKGKAKRGESWEDAAAREIEEEAGFRPRLGPHVGTTRYTVGPLRLKTVRYYSVDAGDAEPQPQNEVDELRWLRPEEALELLSHGRDRQMLSRALPRLA
jgi:8-oxo-dGTP pyrophosphatase MutT (NUDIX family)